MPTSCSAIMPISLFENMIAHAADPEESRADGTTSKEARQAGIVRAWRRLIRNWRQLGGHRGGGGPQKPPQNRAFQLSILDGFSVWGTGVNPAARQLFYSAAAFAMGDPRRTILSRMNFF
jgi:hypothetical protein